MGYDPLTQGSDQGKLNAQNKLTSEKRLYLVFITLGSDQVKYLLYKG